MLNHTITQQDIPKITINISKTKKMFSDCTVQFEGVELLFWNSLGKNVKHCKKHQRFTKSAEINLISSFTI